MQSYNRNVNTSEGPVEILVPRDRNGEFKPHLLDAFKRNSPEFEAKIMALYARGATTKDIADFMEETYGVEISESFVSDITDKVLDLQKEWQSRELLTTYAFAYLDAIHIPTRIDGKVGKRALHVVLANVRARLGQPVRASSALNVCDFPVPGPATMGFRGDVESRIISRYDRRSSS